LVAHRTERREISDGTASATAPRRRGRAARRESRDHAGPPLPITCRRRLSPKRDGKAADSGLDLSLACCWPALPLAQLGSRAAVASAPRAELPDGALAGVPVLLALGPLLLASLLRPFSLARRVLQQASWLLHAWPAPCGLRSYALQVSCAPGVSSWRWSSCRPPARRLRGGWSCPLSCSLSVSSHSFSSPWFCSASDLLPQAPAGSGRVLARIILYRSKLAVSRSESNVFFILCRAASEKCESRGPIGDRYIAAGRDHWQRAANFEGFSATGMLLLNRTEDLVSGPKVSYGGSLHRLTTMGCSR